MNKQLLINRTVTSDDMHTRLNEKRVNWYTPQRYFESFPSVVESGLWDTTSSAGDWTGWFVQKIKNNFYLVVFSQENDIWRGGGYTAYTDNVLATWKDEMLATDSILAIIQEYNELFN